jgi:hypothetical protein
MWEDICGRYELDFSDRAILIQACRMADNCDRIAAQLRKSGLTHWTDIGSEAISPLLVEMRQQALAMARMLAALKLPADDSQGYAREAASGRNPRSHRSGVGPARGPYAGKLSVVRGVPS